MDTMMIELAGFRPERNLPEGESEPTLLLASPATETAPKLAAGRLPLMAFVDAESERVLQESSGLLGRCVITRGGIAKAIEYLSEQRSPQLLIVDISGVDLPLSKMQILADVCEPGTNVVAIGDENDVGLYRDLVEVGVSNYLIKPLTRDVLAKALAPKPLPGDAARAGLKLGKLVAFIGARGGVGTTTLAANLAWYLANRQSRRVALVDLDLQHGDCSLLFNIENTPGFRDALANPLRLDHLLLDRIMTQVGERLFVLGSHEPLDDNIKVTASSIDTLFSVLRSQFHYIIVDIPRIPSPAYRRALEIADRRIIVVDQTIRSMRDGVRVAKLFGDEAENIFVVNRVGEAGKHALSLKDIHGVLQIRPTSLVPFLPALVTPAAHHGLVATSKRGRFADAVGKLALEISGRAPRRKWWSWRAK
jgi:pilus assembly protein CpaE